MHGRIVAAVLAALCALQSPAMRAHAQGPPGQDPFYNSGIGAGSLPPSRGVNPYMPNNYGPSAPTFPTATPTRPSSWPGAPQAPPGGNAPMQSQTRVPPPAGTPQNVMPPPRQSAPPAAIPRRNLAEPPYDPATIVARVGSEVVQANEVLPNVHRMMAQVLKDNAAAIEAMPPEVKKEQFVRLERDAMKRSIEDVIRFKLLLSELRSKVPAEGITKNEERMRKDFNENGITRLMKSYRVSSITDLEDKLRQEGSSLDAQRTVYAENGLAISWLRQQVKDEKEPTHEDMLAYYHEHTTEWDVPARVRWEHMMVKSLNYDSKAQAYRELAHWGNDIQRGAPFAAVAKAHSQDYTAADGGQCDWTTQGSLKSDVLNEALFKLPVGMLSPIFEDDDGFHIVRVLERDDARRTPFIDVQEEIKKQLFDGNKDKHMMQYVEELRKHVPIWTIFDNAPLTAAAPLPQTR